jgi:hypothetical protein
MKINPINKIAIVNELTNVETQAVSLVNYGANEQGFKIVKNLDEYNLNSKSIFDNKGDFLMAVNPKRIEFDVNVFPTVEKVEEYLKGFNYENVSIVEKSGMFVAHSSDTELDLATGEPIIMEDGVTAFLIETEDDLENDAVEKSTSDEGALESTDSVGEEVIDETPEVIEVIVEDASELSITEAEVAEVGKEVDKTIDKDVEKVADDPEVSLTQEIKKFDYWASHEDKEGDFLKSVRSGLDKGLPPSFEYVSELFTKSQIQAIVKGDRALYDKNSGDYLKYMTAMLQVFTDVVTMPEPSTSAVLEMEKSEDSLDAPVVEENQVDKYDEVFKRLAELETKVGLVQAEKSELEAELEKSKDELAQVLNKSKEIEKQLDNQEIIEETIQKRKVVGRVAGLPTRSPKMPIFAMGEHGKLRPL